MDDGERAAFLASSLMSPLHVLARFCLRHRAAVALAWAVVTAALIGAAVAAPGPAYDDFTLPASESGRAAALLGDRAAAEPSGTLVVSAPGGVRGAGVLREVGALIDRMNAVPGVHAASTYADVSPDGTIATLPLEHDGPEAAAALKRLRDAFHARGVAVELAGGDFADAAPGGLTEGIGLLAAAAILLVAFRSPIAAALPLLVGVAGVVCGVCLLTLLQNVVPVPGFAVYLTIMLGLGVGIDYALLVVTRFRTSLAAGRDPGDAVVTAMGTAGTSVLFAGAIVILTGAGICFLGPSLGGGIALASGCGVLLVMLAALTLLPVLLSRIGHRIDRYGLPRLPRRRPGRRPPSYRWSRFVQRRPLPIGLAALGLLLLLAAPAAGLRASWSDAGDRPPTDTTRRAHDLLVQGFGPGTLSPVLLVSSAPLGDAVATAAAVEGVERATPLGPRTALVVPETGPRDARTTELIHRLRTELPPPVLVAGAAAAAADFAEHSVDRLPWTAGAVLLASFVLLAVLFRSLVVPLKAIAVNLLSVGAAYGVIVVVFQWDVLGRGGPIDAWVPITLFVIVFGLSMDYEVFLLSRVQEEYVRTGDNGRAVAEGLAATARVITAGAAIMFCVFAAFGTFDDRALRTMGVGLAGAVFIDATLVRLGLVPATMELLGDRNWWFPRRRRS